MNKIFLIICLFLISCSQKANDPGKTEDNISYCSAGCTNLKRLDCPEGKDLIFPQLCGSTAECETGKCIDGQCVETCEEFCQYMIENKSYLNIKCWQEIKNCKELDSVCRKEN